LLTAQQVGALIGRNTRWVLDQAATGDIPSFKVGRAVRFDQDEIQAWLDTNRRGAVKKPRHLQTTGGQ
jgi:excisionase family DNA binding protein